MLWTDLYHMGQVNATDWVANRDVTDRTILIHELSQMYQRVSALARNTNTAISWWYLGYADVVRAQLESEGVTPDEPE